MLGGHLSASEVVSILVKDNPLAVDDQDYNMDVMVGAVEILPAS